MKKRILVFTLENNEGHDWRRAFKPFDCEVRFIEVDAMNDVACGIQSGPGGEQGRLYVVSKTEGYWNPDGIVWRWGAVKPNWIHEPFLLLLSRYAQPHNPGVIEGEAGNSYHIPMISRPSFHLICANRLRMLSTLASDPAIPMVPHFAFVTGRAIIESKWMPQFPCVVKIGSFHQGLCKMKVENEDQWQDALSFVYPLGMPCVVEQFVNVQRDLRILWIGDEMWTIVREYKGWKANRLISLHVEETTPNQRKIVERCIATCGGAELGALDCAETEQGLKVFEINDAPGLDPEVLTIEGTYDKVAALLMSKIKESPAREN